MQSVASSLCHPRLSVFVLQSSSLSRAYTKSIQARSINRYIHSTTSTTASANMAILSGYPGLGVTVEVDGQRAREYDAPADEVEKRVAETDFYSIPQLPIQGSEPPYTIKYIESKPGKHFAFQLDSTNFKIPSPDGKKHDASYHFSLDGTFTGYYGLPPGTKPKTASYQSGNAKSGWKDHKFQFSTIEQVEGGNSSQVDRAKDYGTLLVKFYHVVHLGYLKPMDGRHASNPTSIRSVSEKALKGRSVDNVVNFESTPLYGPPTASAVELADSRPFAVFEFRYRTMEGLMSEGIVPRPASDDEQAAEPENEHEQPHTPAKPDPESTPTRGIKSEPDNKHGIKRELMDPAPLPVCYKLRRLENGKIEIDLTDD